MGRRLANREGNSADMRGKGAPPRGDWSAAGAGGMQRWKTVLLAASLALIFIHILYVCIGGEADKQYYVSSAVDISSAEAVPCKDLSIRFSSGQKRLNSLELAFDGIADDKAGAIVAKILRGDALIYQTNVSLSGLNNREWKKIFVNAPLRPGEEYELQLSADANCTAIPFALLVGEDTDAPEQLASESNGSPLGGEVAVRYGYLTVPNAFDRVLVSLIWVLIGLCIFLALRYWESIGDAAGRAVSIICGIGKVPGGGAQGRAKTGAASRDESMAHLRGGSDGGALASPRDAALQGLISLAAEILSCMVILHCSGIEFQFPLQVIFYLISVCAVLGSEKKREVLDKICDAGWKRGVFCALCAYAAFALVGQRIFIYPLDKKVTISSLAVYVAAAIWVTPVMRTLLYLFDTACKAHERGIGAAGQDAPHRERGQKGRGTAGFVTAALVLLLLPAAVNLVANNPGISSPDSLLLVGAHSLLGWYDWHPAFYAMMVRAILSVWDSTYAVILVQYFFWAYVLLDLLLFLRSRGMSDKVLLIAAFLLGWNAGNFVQLNTLWKDIPYALSLLWALVLIAKISLSDKDAGRMRLVYLELAVALTGVFLYRKNGAVAFLVIAAAALFFLRKNRRIWLSVGMAVAAIMLVKGPIYQHYEVQETGTHGLYIGLGQDILGAYYAGGEVSEDTLSMITRMTRYNDSEYAYNPPNSNASYDIETEPLEFVPRYLETFVRNPVLMGRAILARMDAAWDIYQGDDAPIYYVNYTETQDNAAISWRVFHTLETINATETQDGQGSWNKYYPKRQYRSVSAGMSAATAYTASSMWISAIEWRSGLMLLLAIAAAAFLLCEGRLRNRAAVLAPIAGQLLGLALSTGWSHFRYFWPLNLMAAALLILLPCMEKEGGGA